MSLVDSELETQSVEKTDSEHEKREGVETQSVERTDSEHVKSVGVVVQSAEKADSVPLATDNVRPSVQAKNVNEKCGTIEPVSH